MEVSGQLHDLATFTLEGKAPSTNSTAWWVGKWISLNAIEERKMYFGVTLRRGGQWKCSAVRFFFSRFHLTQLCQTRSTQSPSTSHKIACVRWYSQTQTIWHTRTAFIHKGCTGMESSLQKIYKTHAMNVWRNTGARSRYYGCSGKATKYYIIWVSVALGFLHAMRMRRIMLSSTVCLALQYFSTLSHKRHDFREKKLLNTKCVFLYSLKFYLKHFTVRRNIITYVHRSSCKEPVILVRF
jgi:hypothetical protein